MNVSQNGWRVIEPDQIETKTRLWLIPSKAGGVQMRLLPGPYGFVLAHFALWFDRQIEDIEATVGDDHAWSYRAIAGSDEWSNHASATAIDLNATLHPQGQSTFTRQQRDQILDVLESRYRNCIKAGMTFRTTIDDMHFEYAAGRTAITELAEDLNFTKLGQRLRETNPWLKWSPEVAA